ncbi:MAG: hypothetical protein ACK55Z_12145, partial [bacterium]
FALIFLNNEHLFFRDPALQIEGKVSKCLLTMLLSPPVIYSVITEKYLTTTNKINIYRAGDAFFTGNRR